ncbi:MAG: hypothetical protein WA740_04580 [Candidatus Binataceae bacterium]
MYGKQTMQMHRGLEAQTGYFVLAVIFSLLFVIVTWRWAALVNPRVWSVWEESDYSISQPVATSVETAPPGPGEAATITRSEAQREQGSKAILLRMFALGMGNAPAQ